MLQQGPELTQDAPASADSESAEPENPSEMPEPPDVDMTETYHYKNSGKKQCSTVFKMMGFKIIIRKNLLRKP